MIYDEKGFVKVIVYAVNTQVDGFEFKVNPDDEYVQVTELDYWRKLKSEDGKVNMYLSVVDR